MNEDRLRLTLRTVIVAIVRGLRRRCPACGKGRIFSTWYTSNTCCPVCRTNFDRLQDHTWAFMYLSTAMLTGIMVVSMFVFVPASFGRGVILVAVAAVALIVGTLPTRKGLALAIEWLIELAWGEGEQRTKDP